MYLCTLDERVELLAELGLELIITHPFNEQVRYTRAAAFVDALCAALDLQQLWGASFSLGHNREGDREFLEHYGQERGFTVPAFDALASFDGQVVSSSRVRQALAQGDIQQVSGCLGRHYRVTGPVARGDGRGRQIGVPTANIQAWEELTLPASGVYATLAHVGRSSYMAATNVGVRPTVDGQHLTVEAHLLDFEGDLYGKTLSLDFVARLRGEQKFPGLDALVAQIRTDIEHTRALLAAVR
jgi:riboflavin kinase/FMN adenylyltransferase